MTRVGPMTGVALGLTPDAQWDVGVLDYLDAASAAGFGTVGLRAAQATEETGAALRERGLRCHELLSLRMNEADLAAGAGALATAAAHVGAEWVLIGGFRGAVDAATVERVGAAADVVVQAGARLAVEFSTSRTKSCVADALVLVDAVGAHRAGVLIDTWHFFHGIATWDELEAIPLDRIAYVQFADAPPPASDDLAQETLHRRALPGDGVLELDRFARTLLDRGWQGVVSAEVLNADLRGLPVADVARRAYDSTARYWR